MTAAHEISEFRLRAPDPAYFLARILLLRARLLQNRLSLTGNSKTDGSTEPLGQPQKARRRRSRSYKSARAKCRDRWPRSSAPPLPAENNTRPPAARNRKRQLERSKRLPA